MIFATNVVAPGLQLAKCRKEVAALLSSSLALNTLSLSFKPVSIFMKTRWSKKAGVMFVVTT